MKANLVKPGAFTVLTLLLLAIQFSHGRRFDVPQDNNADDEEIDSGLPGARFIELKREKKVGFSEGFPTFNEREKRQTARTKCRTLAKFVRKSSIWTVEDKRYLCRVVNHCRIASNDETCSYETPRKGTR